MVKINFAEVEEFQRLPKGRYHFAVSDYEIKELGEDSKAPGKDYWRLELTVQDGAYADRTEHTNVFLPPDYDPKYLAAILRSTVGQHDWSEEELKNGEFDVDAEDLLTLEFIAEVSPQKGSDMFNNIGFPRPVPEDWEPEDGESGDDLP